MTVQLAKGLLTQQMSSTTEMYNKVQKLPQKGRDINITLNSSETKELVNNLSLIWSTFWMNWLIDWKHVKEKTIIQTQLPEKGNLNRASQKGEGRITNSELQNQSSVSVWNRPRPFQTQYNKLTVLISNKYLIVTLPNCRCQMLKILQQVSLKTPK